MQISYQQAKWLIETKVDMKGFHMSASNVESWAFNLKSNLFLHV